MAEQTGEDLTRSHNSPIHDTSDPQIIGQQGLEPEGWTIINQEEEFESAVLGLNHSSLGELILEDSVRPSPNIVPKESSHSSLSQEQLIIQGLEEQVLSLTRALEMERDRQEHQVVSLLDETNLLKRERGVQENEIRALRKERDFWQKKSVEAMEGIRVHEDVLTAGFHSLRSRLCHLAQEARAYRLLEESGGSLSATDATAAAGTELRSQRIISPTCTMSVDTSAGCGVDSNLEETLNALIELENEFIPIISKLHSVYSHPQPAVASAASLSPHFAPKISLSSFEENDLALFFPTPKGDYLAFNCGAPHHYLSAESKALIGQDKHFRKIYVLGKIIFKEEKVATAVDSPYHLAPGIKYYEVSVASVTSQL